MRSANGRDLRRAPGKHKVNGRQGSARFRGGSALVPEWGHEIRSLRSCTGLRNRVKAVNVVGVVVVILTVLVVVVMTVSLFVQSMRD